MLFINGTVFVRHVKSISNHSTVMNEQEDPISLTTPLFRIKQIRLYSFA